MKEIRVEIVKLLVTKKLAISSEIFVSIHQHLFDFCFQPVKKTEFGEKYVQSFRRVKISSKILGRRE